MTAHREKISEGNASIGTAPLPGLQPMAEAYVAFLRHAGELQMEMLRFVGDRLEKDVAFSSKLLECKNPGEVLQAQLEFCNCFMDDYLKESRRIGEAVSVAANPLGGNGARKH